MLLLLSVIVELMQIIAVLEPIIAQNVEVVLLLLIRQYLLVLLVHLLVSAPGQVLERGHEKLALHVVAVVGLLLLVSTHELIHVVLLLASQVLATAILPLLLSFIVSAVYVFIILVLDQVVLAAGLLAHGIAANRLLVAAILLDEGLEHLCQVVLLLLAGVVDHVV